MKILINLFVCISICLAVLFLSGMDGCNIGGEPVAFVEATPADGSTIQPDATIIATFDASPTDLSVTGGTLSLSETTATIVGPFTPGALTLVLTWSDGTMTLTYTVDSGKPGDLDEAGIPEGMVLIQEGEFQMGSEDDEALPREQPIHTVHVDAFYMDKYEVTNLDFKKFVLANPEWEKGRIPNALHDGNYLKHWTGNNYPRGKTNHPVTNVSWYAAVAYSKWVGKRLPTEAEWEKAARGGESGWKYPWGDTISDARANYGGKVGDTTDVDEYLATGYDLHDMCGNVWEWCLDAYDENFYFASPRWNPLSDVDILSNVGSIIDNYKNVRSFRVLRGGSWFNTAPFMRVAYRFSAAPTSTNNDIGFRCAKSVTR